MCNGSPDPLICGVDLQIRSGILRSFTNIQHQTALKINGSGDPLHNITPDTSHGNSPVQLVFFEIQSRHTEQ